MLNDLFKIKSLSVLSVFIVSCVYSSCNLQQEESPTVLNINKEILCGSIPDLDSSLLKLESYKNLDIYNGIKNYQFNSNKSDYIDCIECKTMTNTIDSCLFKKTLIFLNNDWQGNLYFIDDKLCGIDISCVHDKMNDIYYSLRTIFGPPNQSKIKVLDSKKISKKINVASLWPVLFKDYNEELYEYTSAFSENAYLERNHATQLSFDENIFVKNSSNKVETKKVNYKYYEKITLNCTWKSNVIMDYYIYIKPFIKNYDHESNSASFGGISSTSKSNLFLYKDKSSKEIIESGKLDAKNLLLIKSKRIKDINELNNDKKLLKEF